MAKYTNTTTAPIHVGGVMIIPGASADIPADEPMLKSKSFQVMLDEGMLHPGELTEEEKADLAAQEKAMAERLAQEGKDANGKPAKGKA